MGIGVSIFLIAVGAILSFAINTEAEGFNINAIGYILMACGALGLLVTTLIFGTGGTSETTTTTPPLTNLRPGRPPGLPRSGGLLRQVGHQLHRLRVARTQRSAASPGSSPRPRAAP